MKGNIFLSEQEFQNNLIALFESGAATPEQRAELAEAVLSASGRDVRSVRAILKGIGFEWEVTV